MSSLVKCKDSTEKSVLEIIEIVNTDVDLTNRFYNNCATLFISYCINKVIELIVMRNTNSQRDFFVNQCNSQIGYYCKMAIDKAKIFNNYDFVKALVKAYTEISDEFEELKRYFN